MQAVSEREARGQVPRKKKFEIFQKTFKKPLDKRTGVWYNTEAVRESGSELIIEN